MKAKDSFTPTWCEKHKNWHQYNCPDCYVDDNEEEIRHAGINEVVDFVEQEGVMYRHGDTLNRWRAQLEEWGI